MCPGHVIAPIYFGVTILIPTKPSSQNTSRVPFPNLGQTRSTKALLPENEMTCLTQHPLFVPSGSLSKDGRNKGLGPVYAAGAPGGLGRCRTFPRLTGNVLAPVYMLALPQYSLSLRWWTWLLLYLPLLCYL